MHDSYKYFHEKLKEINNEIPVLCLTKALVLDTLNFNSYKLR